VRVVNAYNILVENLKGKEYCGNRELAIRITLKLTIKKQIIMERTGRKGHGISSDWFF
jgi:hypothetical protein